MELPATTVSGSPTVVGDPLQTVGPAIDDAHDERGRRGLRRASRSGPRGRRASVGSDGTLGASSRRPIGARPAPSTSAALTALLPQSTARIMAAMIGPPTGPTARTAVAYHRATGPRHWEPSGRPLGGCVSSERPAKFFVNDGLVSNPADIYHLLRPLLRQTVAYRYLRGGQGRRPRHRLGRAHRGRSARTSRRSSRRSRSASRSPRGSTSSSRRGPTSSSAYMLVQGDERVVLQFVPSPTAAPTTRPSRSRCRFQLLPGYVQMELDALEGRGAARGARDDEPAGDGTSRRAPTGGGSGSPTAARVAMAGRCSNAPRCLTGRASSPLACPALALAVGGRLRAGRLARQRVASESGLAHFMEHITFKGTRDLPTSREVSEAHRGRGRHAATPRPIASRPSTGCACPCARPTRAFHVLADLTLRPLLRSEDIARERDIIVEEIRSYRDDPGQFVFNLWDEAYFGDTPLGWEIAGDEETVRALSDTDIRDFWAAGYRPVEPRRRGRRRHRATTTPSSLVDRTLRPRRRGPRRLAACAGRAGRARPPRAPRHLAGHVCLGLAGLPRDHADQWSLELLNTSSARAPSSRLFLKVREEEGLAYDVHSFQTDYADCGTPPGLPRRGSRRRRPGAALRRRASWRACATSAVPDAELEKARNYTTGRLELRLEESRAMASFLGGQEALHDRVLTMDEVIEAIRVGDRGRRPGPRRAAHPRRGAVRRGHRAEPAPPVGSSEVLRSHERPGRATRRDRRRRPTHRASPRSRRQPAGARRSPSAGAAARRCRRRVPAADPGAVSPCRHSGRRSPRPGAATRPAFGRSAAAPVGSALRAASRTGVRRPGRSRHRRGPLPPPGRHLPSGGPLAARRPRRHPEPLRCHRPHRRHREAAAPGGPAPAGRCRPPGPPARPPPGVAAAARPRSRHRPPPPGRCRRPGSAAAARCCRRRASARPAPIRRRAVPPATDAAPAALRPSVRRLRPPRMPVADGAAGRRARRRAAQRRTPASRASTCVAASCRSPAPRSSRWPAPARSTARPSPTWPRCAGGAATSRAPPRPAMPTWARVATSRPSTSSSPRSTPAAAGWPRPRATPPAVYVRVGPAIDLLLRRRAAQRRSGHRPRRAGWTRRAATPGRWGLLVGGAEVATASVTTWAAVPLAHAGLVLGRGRPHRRECARPATRAARPSVRPAARPRPRLS